jgi:predicted unusual protein kinase regulating ubiquinone biosynthesis (AarF/ABC1/UbiB family)
MILSSCSGMPPLDSGPDKELYRSIANANIGTDLSEFKKYFQSSISDDRKKELTILQENILKYFIEASKGSDTHKLKTFDEASVYFNKIFPIILNNIKNEQSGIFEFIEIKQAPLWTLKEEIRFLNILAANLPDPKIKINLIEGLEFLSSTFQSISSGQKEVVLKNTDSMFSKILGEKAKVFPSSLEIEEVLSTKGSQHERIIKLIGLVDTRVSTYETRLRNIGNEISKNKQIDLGQAQIRVVIRFMDYYFNKMPLDVIKTILSEILSAGSKTSEEEIMKIVFQNTGPGLGKLMQQIGKEKGIGDVLSKLMAILESNGKAVPIHLVREVIKADSGGFEVRSIIEKPVGTGTIAQVSRGQLWVEDKEVETAIRYLKPGVAKRCKEDIAILRQFVPDNEVLLADEGFTDTKIFSTLISSVEGFLNEEVDLNLSVERQKTAYEIYNRSLKLSTNSKFEMLEFHVPKVYISPTGQSNLHIQEFASGGSKFLDINDLDLKKLIAKEMVRLWFEEALFKSGFLNADLHQGNFRVVLVEDNKKIKVIVYDFGLSATLSKADQRAFLLLGAGAYLSSPKILADGLMLSMNSNDGALRSKLLMDIEKEIKNQPIKSPEAWVVWSVQKNYFVSEKLGAFARGSLLIKQLPVNVGEIDMFKDTIMKVAIKNLGHALADRKYIFPLTSMDLIKISTAQIKKTCVEIFQTFFKK